MTGWRFAIDRGGTFTDVVAMGPGGEVAVAKLLSVNPERYQDAALEGIRQTLDRHGARWDDVSEIRLGTTVVTNALLERKGARVVLAVTQGFADALEIGAQARPQLFVRHIVKPEALHGCVVEVRERVTADGEILVPLDEAGARRDLAAAFEAGFRSVAIACLHGYAFPAHEQRLAAIAAELGFTQISLSSAMSRLIKFVPRADTAVADAYLSPVLDAYVDAFAESLPGEAARRLLFMQSNGGLARAGAFRGHSAVLSGPAGGVVGMAEAAKRAGFTRALGFDIGGTSTDVSHYDGGFERTHDTVVAGVRLAAPMLQVHTVAAGGGSICAFDGARLRVGPHSAGADPGPACYRRGGPLTLTDCNLLLGRIRADRFPKVFGPDGDLALDEAVVVRKFEDLCAQIAQSTATPMTPQQAAEGFVAIADQAMAEALKKISIQRGRDPADYVLVAFGGAGGQHACAVADEVGVNTILLHPLAGVLSAWGIGFADLRALAEETVETRLADMHDLDARAAALAERASADLTRQGARDIEVTLTASLKYAGADSSIEIPVERRDAMAAAFEAAHRARFRFVDGARPVVLAALRAEAVARTSAPPCAVAPVGEAPPSTTVTLVAQGRAQEAQVFQRAGLAPGAEIEGPALVLEEGATSLVDCDWRARVTERGDLVLTRQRPRAARSAIGGAVDPILLEVFNNRFMAIAEEMGLTLQTTASSVNIKERLDFSCAIFDGTGALVANAPHIPVHLGSMGESVREIVRRRGQTMRDGEVYMLNAPHAGGTHLPDITLIAPVFLDGEAEASFFTAARGHHGDVGGLTPGSMPPHSRSIEDEGVLIEDFLIAERGEIKERQARALFAGGLHPARDIDRNIADLKAQLAACARGGDELRRLVAQYGRHGVEAYMRHVQDNAEEHVRRIIAQLEPGAAEAPLDIGAVIRVRIVPDQAARRVRIDFTGTSPQHSGNFNAPLAITRAAILYVFRTLIDDNIPLNEGCLKPIEIVVPEGCLLNPRRGAAVVAGNVETSQVVVDALYAALGVLAASCGTMNNFTFGDAERQYYETVAGGAGAGPDFDGASVVQTHMTNSRLTDPEVLESRFPVLVDGFAIKRGSGGAGAHRGGDGAVRRIRFLSAMSAAILSNRRLTAPFGLAGGAPGACGANWVERANGSVTPLGATDQTEMAPGDVFVIETPGGGGYGPPAPIR